MQSNKKITKYLPAMYRQKKHGFNNINNHNDTCSSSHLEKQRREQAKLSEQLELENIKEIFLQNKVKLKGRRKAVTETELADQIRKFDSINGSPIFAFKNRSKNSFLNLDDEWDLKEIKKIVMYQTQPKRQLSDANWHYTVDIMFISFVGVFITYSLYR